MWVDVIIIRVPIYLDLFSDLTRTNEICCRSHLTHWDERNVALCCQGLVALVESFIHFVHQNNFGLLKLHFSISKEKFKKKKKITGIIVAPWLLPQK